MVAKWTEALIIDLAFSGLSGVQLAKKYGKSERTISRLRNDEEIKAQVAQLRQDNIDSMSGRCLDLSIKAVKVLDETLTPLDDEVGVPSHVRKKIAAEASRSALEVLKGLGILGGNNGSTNDGGVTNNVFGKVIVMPGKVSEEEWQREAKEVVGPDQGSMD